MCAKFQFLIFTKFIKKAEQKYFKIEFHQVKLETKFENKAMRERELFKTQ